MDWNGFNNQVSTIIRDAGALDDLLSGLGCGLVWKNGKSEFRFPCPVHGGDGLNCVIKTNGQTVPINWKCHSHHCHNHFKTSLLGLVRGILTCQQDGPWDPDRDRQMVPLKRAAEYLDRFVAGLPARPRRPPMPTARPPRSRWTRQQVRAQLEIPSPYFVGLGFSPAVLDAMDVGYSPKLKRSVVPFYDDDGQYCIGHIARLEMDACPKCRSCHRADQGCDRGRNKWSLSRDFPKTECGYLYGFADAAQSSLPYVVLVEGAKEVWRLREVDIPAVACLGCELLPTQAKKLVGLRKEVLVAFDNDDSGRDGAKLAHERLLKLRGLVRVVTVPAIYKDLAEMPAPAVADWFRANMPR
jgi:hypothetical protein